MRPCDLVFDLDGTLTDPLRGISRCVNHALTCQGQEEAPEASVAALIGPPLDQIFQTLVPGASAAVVEEFVAKYRERYALLGYAENEIYDGVADALTSLSEAGLRMGVCTSKRVDFAEKILEHFGLRSHFEFVDGGDVGVSKAQQLEALRRNGWVGAHSRMIGDRAVDILAAHENGLSSVGVLWGYGSRAELAEAGADEILTEPERLLQLLPAEGA